MQTVVATLSWYNCASCIPVTDGTLAAGVVVVDAETDEVPVRAFKVPEIDRTSWIWQALRSLWLIERWCS